MTSPLLLSTTLATASVLGLLYMVLLLRIVRMRFGKRISMGDGGNPELLKRIRAHGNFAEYVPLVLILMALLELAGTDQMLLAIAGGALVTFRICHAIGMHRPAPNAFRFIGTVGTFLMIIVFCVFGLWLALSATPAAAETKADVERVVSWTPGEYSNRDQAAAKAAGNVAADIIVEQRHLFVSRLNMPQVGAATIYLEWLGGDEKGKIVSQRVWSFEPKADHIAMRFYTLKDSAKAVLVGTHSAAKADAAKADALTLNDLNPYPDNCTFILKRKSLAGGKEAYEGMSGTGDCKIYNRSVAADMVPAVRLMFAEGEIVEDGVFTYDNPKTPGAAVPPREHIVSEFKRIRKN